MVGFREGFFNRSLITASFRHIRRNNYGCAYPELLPELEVLPMFCGSTDGDDRNGKIVSH